MTITDKQVTLFADLFKGRTDVYGTYDPATNKAWQVKAPVTDRVIRDHLIGQRPCGIYLLTGEMIAAGAVDFDHGDTRAPAEFVRRMAAAGISAYVERSKSKGYHVWVFFGPGGVKAKAFRALAQDTLNQMGCPATEIFPKQDAILSPSFYGNFINAPLAGPLVAKGRTVFVDEQFVPFPDQWAFLAGVQRVSADTLESAARSRLAQLFATPVVPANCAPPAERHATTCSALMPCAQRMLMEGVKENQRAACFRLAAQLRKAGLPFDYAILVLRKWAEKNRPSDGKAIITLSEIGDQTRCAYGPRMYLACGCNDPSVVPFCVANCPLRRRREIQEMSGSTTGGAKDVRA